MAQPLTFQQIITTLQQFWAAQGCVLAQPYNIQVGAGTNNPATLLRVLGPEAWRVAYVEPSVRPDDGRYGENPNRMQYYHQYQVILKPDPGNPQELYLQSLEALGINPREHDIRFVEDNWESPGLGAWGLGWEVWLDGQEITQFTYFQQAGGLELDPVAVEITYGLERIALPLQGKNSVWQLDWLRGQREQESLLFGDLLLRAEIEHCTYYFELADVEGLKTVFNIYEGEYKRAADAGLVMPAYDYVLKCNHLFNVLDTRGAIGVTERAVYFRRMRDMTRRVAKAFAEQRQTMEYPLEKMNALWDVQAPSSTAPLNREYPTTPADFLLEIGVEELPAGDVDDALAHLRAAAPKLLDDLRLGYESVQVYATPRRLVVHARNLVVSQPDRETIAKGPSADRAYDADGKPTKAAEGFARGRGVAVEALEIAEMDGGRYVTARVFERGRAAAEVLAEALPGLIAGIKFGKSMRWNRSNVAFSRPLRWIIALLGEAVVKFSYAGVESNQITRGLRPYGSPESVCDTIEHYFTVLGRQGILLNYDERRAAIAAQIGALALSIGGTIPQDDGLLDEVTNLVEAPQALLGTFEERFLELPRDVLVTVMRDKQRYFPVEDSSGKLMPYFITVRNGDAEHLDKVRAGNEAVLRARFSDADYFFSKDKEKPLADYLPRLDTLTFQEKLGSMLAKNRRLEDRVEPLGRLLGIHEDDIATARRAAALAKADLATQVVVEMTSLQGTMGREYARMSGEPETVAQAIYEHWLPRGADDGLPASEAGALLAITDRLDSLTGLFAAGLAPQSTADPYGLRRAALGIIQVLVNRNISVDLRQAIDLSAEAQPIEVSPEVRAQVLEFIGGRLRAWMLEQGLPTDEVTAVLAEQTANPARALAGVRQLVEWVKRPDWEALLDGFARCVRITRVEKDTYPVDAAAFSEDVERNLYAAYQSAAGTLGAEANVDQALGAFAPMLPAVTAFFDGVMVHAEDVAVRRNRLGLLQLVAGLMKGRADLSKLAGF